MRQNVRITIILALLYFSLQGKSQDLNNFQVLKSEGEVPEEFNTPSSEKVKEDIKSVSKDQKRLDQKSEKRFILESNYIIDQMLTNGAILYNDELSQYVTKVADELLKDDQELRSNLRFYILKSTQVNAFATDRGTIFITIGLLAQIENEAQLAYVLAHEIIHYKNKHAKTGFVENDKIEQGRGEYKRIKWDKAFNKSKYSKELELEADMEGLSIFLKSKYSLKEINSVFYVLQYANLPTEDILFDSTYFSDIYFDLPSNCIKKELDPIKAIDDENDEYLTHPNINKRRAVINDAIEGKSNEGRIEFLYSKEKFYKVKSLAQFELSFLYTKQRNYGEAIYNSYTLLKKYPNNTYLETNIGYCLYALAKYKNAGKIHSVLTDYDDVQGQSQQVYYLLDHLDKKALNTLAVKYLWDLKKEIKNDPFLNTIAEDALAELLLESGARKFDYKKSFPKVDTLSNVEITEESKYDKIKKDIEMTDGNLPYAFVMLFKNDEFDKLMNKYEKKYVEKVKKTEEIHDKLMSEIKKEKVGRALGIDKVVMVSPNYKRFDLRKEITERHKFAENRKEDFIELNKFCAEKRGVELGLISNTYFESTEQYNDMALLNDWMDERFDHDNVKIYPYCKIYTDNLVTKYGTPYFGWTGMYSLRAKKDQWGLVALSTVLYGVGVIYGIVYAFTPEEHTFYYTYLVDITNYDFLMTKEDYVKMKDYNDLMKSYIYDSYNQIKTQKKIKVKKDNIK